MFHCSFKSWLEWSELISANKGCLSFGSVCWFDHCGCLRNMDLNYEGNEVKNEKNNGNWRAEIDRSAPFESVKEAVSRFGGVGYWKPTLRLNYKISSAEKLPELPDRSTAAALLLPLSMKDKHGRTKEENHKLLNGNAGDPADWRPRSQVNVKILEDGSTLHSDLAMNGA